MKNTLFRFIVLMLTNISLAQTDGSYIAIGHVDTIYSEILEENREIWIHTPNNYGEELFNDTYPVLFLLDGDAHFSSVTGLIKQLSSINGNSVLPKMIVVGIPNTNRWRDLSPTSVKTHPTSGGNKLFLDFIEKELIKYVEDKYPAAKNRTFVGHSLGGLTVINTLLKRPHLFNNFIAIDPSLWWDDQYLLKQSDTLMKNLDLKNKSLYVGIANTMSNKMEYSTIMSDTSQASLHIRSILEFTSNVEQKYNTDLNFKWKYYEDDTHGSVPLITEYDGLRFLFSWYECECYAELINKNSKLSGTELLSLLTTHYKSISTKMGYPVIPKEEEVNGLGYWYLENGDFDKALSFLSFVVQNYPNSFNAYDSIGDYYLAIGDKKNAIKSFEKCLELGGYPYTKEKLDKLKSK